MISGLAPDWQFVVVTLAALGGAGVLLRPFWPARRARKPAGGCGGCSGGNCKKGSSPPPERLVSLGRTGSRKP